MSEYDWSRETSPCRRPSRNPEVSPNPIQGQTLTPCLSVPPFGYASLLQRRPSLVRGRIFFPSDKTEPFIRVFFLIYSPTNKYEMQLQRKLACTCLPPWHSFYFQNIIIFFSDLHLVQF